MCWQVCDSDKVRRNEHGKPLEADLTARLGHPNLVSTIDAASSFREAVPKLAWEMAKEGEEAAADGVDNPAQPEVNEPVEETWLLLEYCDQGSLMVGCSPDKTIYWPVISADLLSVFHNVGSQMHTSQLRPHPYA